MREIIQITHLRRPLIPVKLMPWQIAELPHPHVAVRGEEQLGGELRGHECFTRTLLLLVFSYVACNDAFRPSGCAYSVVDFFELE